MNRFHVLITDANGATVGFLPPKNSWNDIIVALKPITKWSRAVVYEESKGKVFATDDLRKIAPGRWGKKPRPQPHMKFDSALFFGSSKYKALK